MNIIEHLSANYNSREGHLVDMLVLHYTDMVSAAEALDKLCDKSAEVSAHYLVDDDGLIYKLVDEKNRAWHAGKSYWRGNSNINQRSIGIEISNPGHRFGYRNFPEKQMNSVLNLCKDILARHPITARNVVGHSDIAPARKKDPGELFNWKMLAENGVGIWPNQSIIATANITETTTEIISEEKAKKKLVNFGYDISDLKAAIIAFQRHYRQNLLNGKWDNECDTILQSIKLI